MFKTLVEFFEKFVTLLFRCKKLFYYLQKSYRLKNILLENGLNKLIVLKRLFLAILFFCKKKSENVNKI